MTDYCRKCHQIGAQRDTAEARVEKLEAALEMYASHGMPSNKSLQQSARIVLEGTKTPSSTESESIKKG